ncbi:hypothetical protein PIB30_101399 [Stylosanthes scabra]|uniref:Uncharacterized protein n=1 Tax=Stylosanthes scabra TaxID=79078 RepID=A0ABU6YYW5_9FABA|nr:hypothetical protein [Stylosanthes scabra]
MEKLQKKVQQALQGYSVMHSIPRITDKLGVEGQQRRAQTKLKKTLATHAYACPPRICVLFNSPTPLLHSSLTPPRICVAFYAYACHIIPHPAQPSFYTKATLPTHMRALHAYACYHNTQHHHTLPCLTYLHTKATLPRICVTFYAYAWHNPYPLYLTLPHHSTLTTFHPSTIILTNNPRICAVAYAYAWNTAHKIILHTPSSPIAIISLNQPTHMRTTLRICVAIILYFQPYSPVSTHMRATLRICVETPFPSLRLADHIGHVHA